MRTIFITSIAIIIISSMICQQINHPTLKRYRSTASRNGRTIIYKKYFDMDNSITGSGSYLKDVAYKRVCQNMMCPSLCCEGPINVMQCGLVENCKKYQDYMNIQTIILAIVIPCVILIFCALSFMNSCDESCKPFWVVIICIILFPIGIGILTYLLIKKICGSKDDEINNNKPNHDIRNDNVGKDINYNNDNIGIEMSPAEEVKNNSNFVNHDNVNQNINNDVYHNINLNQNNDNMYQNQNLNIPANDVNNFTGLPPNLENQIQNHSQLPINK